MLGTDVCPPPARNSHLGTRRRWVFVSRDTYVLAKAIFSRIPTKKFVSRACSKRGAKSNQCKAAGPVRCDVPVEQPTIFFPGPYRSAVIRQQRGCSLD